MQLTISESPVVFEPLDLKHSGTECPNTKVVSSYHNMLTLPARFTPQLLSYRSCVAHTEETVIADIVGAGTIRKFWIVTGMGNDGRPDHCTFTGNSLKMWVRVYFDNETVPRIETPLGAMFGYHHDIGENWGDPYGADNLLFKVTENGAFTLVAPMPFATRCKVTVQDEDPSRKMRIWAQVRLSTIYTVNLLYVCCNWCFE